MKKFKSIAAAFIAGAALTTSASAVISKPNPKIIMQKNELTKNNKALVLKAYQELFGDHNMPKLRFALSSVYSPLSFAWS